MILFLFFFFLLKFFEDSPLSHKMWRSVITFAFGLSLVLFKQDEFGWNLVF